MHDVVRYAILVLGNLSSVIMHSGTQCRWLQSDQLMVASMLYRVSLGLRDLAKDKKAPPAAPPLHALSILSRKKYQDDHEIFGRRPEAHKKSRVHMAVAW